MAKLASEAGALTIGVATIPFSFEGSRRTQIAADGLTQLESHVDALIPVYNDKLLDYAGPHTSFSDAFILADDMLSRGVQGIANLITTTGLTSKKARMILTIAAITQAMVRQLIKSPK